MRTLSSLALAALSGAQVVSRLIARFTLPSGTFGASDGTDFFTWDNGAGPVVFTPLADTAKVTIPPLETALRTDSALLQLSATDPNVIADLLEADYRAAPTDIALLLFDPTTGQPGEEFIRFRGVADQPSISDDPIKAPGAGGKLDEASTSTLTMSVAPQTIDMDRSRGRMATDPDQRLFRDANDGFFQDVAMVGVSTINWGQAGASSPAASAFNHSQPGSPSGVAGGGGASGRGGGNSGMRSI